MEYSYWDPKIEPLKEPDTYRHISMCTTVMNRLRDLQVTLPKNIEDSNLYQGRRELVILDYNSSDGLEQWMKDNMWGYIRSGIVSYYRTTEPKYYSMTHSRNIAFKLAAGIIVNNVDADNFIKPGFFDIINQFAMIQPKKALFAKGRHLLRGRIGFYKEDFLNLGGYDEELTGYGHDDRDLWIRSLMSGFKLMWFGGSFIERIHTSNPDKIINMENKSWKATEHANKALSQANHAAGKLIANQGKHWGKATVTKNFTEEIQI